LYDHHPVFSCWIKAKRVPNRTYTHVGKISTKTIEMRFAHEGKSGAGGEKVVLVFHGCQQLRGVFRLPRAVRLLRTVLHEARKVYEFEVRGLRVEDDRV
jgi:hypothetical protein